MSGLETIDAPSAEFVAFDLETTGLSAESDRIVEVGAVRFDASGEVLGRVRAAGQPAPPSGPARGPSTGSPTPSWPWPRRPRSSCPSSSTFLGDPDRTTLLAHNASFDAGFLGRELARLGPADARPRGRRHAGPGPPDDGRSWAATGSISWPGGSGSTPTGRTGPWPIAGASEGSGWPSNRGRSPASRRSPTRSSTPVAPCPRRRVGDGSRRRSACDQVVRIEYAGGTRGLAPREITPRRFSNRGGVAYLVALCHLDRKEKQFRLDRVRNFEVVKKPAIRLKEGRRTDGGLAGERPVGRGGEGSRRRRGLGRRRQGARPRPARPGIGRDLASRPGGGAPDRSPSASPWAS